MISTARGTETNHAFLNKVADITDIWNEKNTTLSMYAIQND